MDLSTLPQQMPTPSPLLPAGGGGLAGGGQLDVWGWLAANLLPMVVAALGVGIPLFLLWLKQRADNTTLLKKQQLENDERIRVAKMEAEQVNHDALVDSERKRAQAAFENTMQQNNELTKDLRERLQRAEAVNADLVKQNVDTSIRVTQLQGRLDDFQHKLSESVALIEEQKTVIQKITLDRDQWKSLAERRGDKIEELTQSVGILQTKLAQLSGGTGLSKFNTEVKND